jgi:hypothetical protein
LPDSCMAESGIEMLVLPCGKVENPRKSLQGAVGDGGSISRMVKRLHFLQLGGTRRQLPPDGSDIISKCACPTFDH